MQRRNFLATAGGVVAAGLAGCLGGPDPGDASVRTVEVESSISAAVFRWGIREGVWDDRGVDLAFETAPYGRYNRQIVDDEADIGAPSAVAQLGFMERGEPLTFVAPQQNMFNRMFARADDAIDDPTDLGGRTLGLPSALSSTTSAVHRVLVADEYGFDIVDDTADTRAADPPALWEFVHDGELDAVSQFSGFTIRGIADDRLQTVFDPHELWRRRADSGIPTTAFTVRSGWLAENRGLADDFLDGWGAALSSFRANVGDALAAFGDEAGITTDADADVVADLMEREIAFGPTRYDNELVEAHWGFFELLADADVVSLGDRDTTFTTAGTLQD